MHGLLCVFLQYQRSHAESLSSRLGVEAGACGAASPAVFLRRCNNIPAREPELVLAPPPPTPVALEKYISQEPTEVRKDLEPDLPRLEAKVIQARLQNMEADQRKC